MTPDQLTPGALYRTVDNNVVKFVRFTQSGAALWHPQGYMARQTTPAEQFAAGLAGPVPQKRHRLAKTGAGWRPTWRAAT